MYENNAGEVLYVNIPVISIIGWSGVGKTTFFEKLIKVLKEKGIRLGVVKQDGHEFDVDKEGKDSFTYNRYAQIQADLTEKETSFELLVADAFAIHLNYKDLKKIGADYILTSEKYDYSNLEYVKGANGFYIYHVTG